MTPRTLGKSGPSVSAIGLGAMGMSPDWYGETDRTESLATLDAALEAGVTLIDTGDFYGSGHNEMLIGEALAGSKRDKALISVKYGALRGPDGALLGVDTRPAATKNFLTMTLRRLRTDHIDIYRPARLDPSVPIEDTIGAIAELVQAGYVRHIGLSEVGADTIRRAHSVHPIADLQIEYSLISRGVEKAILPTLRELGIGLTAYGVLSRGLISGHWNKARSEQDKGFRGNSPRFQGDNLDHNLKLAEKLGELARKKGVSTAQLAIAWVMAQGSDIVPLVGARTRQRLAESLGALDVTLAKADLAEIAAAFPPEVAAGERYSQHGMASLDSEKNG